MAGIHESMPVCQWQAEGRAPINIPTSKIRESCKRRHALRRRPWRRGAKIDKFGPEARVWEIDVLFHNGSSEAGIEPDTLYPDVLNELLDTFDVDETGTLSLPTRGPVRVVWVDYERVEDNSESDAAAVRLTFFEDNEEGTDAASFTHPSASAVARLQAEECTDELTDLGTFGDLVSSLTSLGDDLQELAHAPGNFVDDLEGGCYAVIHKVEQVEATFVETSSEAGAEVTALLTKPEASRAGRLLRKFSDTAGRTLLLTGAGRVVVRRFATQRSIFDVAAELQQNPATLVQMNATIPDLLAIPAGTPVRVLAAP